MKRKRVLICMLWLCALACFSGFPWMFLPWDAIEPYMGGCERSAMTLVLFRQQCVFFGFFCIYFLFLGRMGKYQELIGYASVLIAVMGFLMYLLKLRTGMDNASSNYEPFIWLAVGSVILWLNHGMEGVKPERHRMPVASTVFQIYAVLLCLNIVCLLFPQQAWNLMFTTPFSNASAYDRYTFGLVSGFMAFSSIIVYYLSDRLGTFLAFSKAVLIFSLLYFGAYLLWQDCLELYTPLFIGYIAFVEILMVVGLIFVMNKEYKEQ